MNEWNDLLKKITNRPNVQWPNGYTMYGRDLICSDLERVICVARHRHTDGYSADIQIIINYK